MALADHARRNHTLFPNQVSMPAATDPELIDVVTQLLPFIGSPVDAERVARDRRGRARMNPPPMKVLAVGATGSIGHLVVEEARRRGHDVRALVRDSRKARGLAAGVKIVIGDLTRPETLTPAIEGVEAIVFTHGWDGGGKAGAERVDYGGVRNVLAALDDRSVRIALMTAIGVTNREGDYNRRSEAHD
jgi:NADPH:quinone reductase-like Zn-dependent oxidoreductase